MPKPRRRARVARAAPKARLRRIVYRQLDPMARRRGLSPTNLAIVGVILVSVAVTVVQTEPTVARGHEAGFDLAEKGFVAAFALEYALRLWTIVERPGFTHPLLGRLKWAVSPMALIDLIAWAPSLLLPALAPAYMLRIFRLARILTLAKLGRMSRAWSLIASAVAARRFELTIVACVGLFVLLLSSTALYLVEGPAQPERFGSIPRAIWWSAMTLTTIGYGDVYPVTPLGRLLAIATAVSGVCLIAAPAGILAGAFSEAFQRHRREQEEDAAEASAAAEARRDAA